MGRNNVIIVVSIILIMILAITFTVCTWKLNELRLARQKSRMSNNDLKVTEDVSRTKDSPPAKYLNFTVYREDNTEVSLSEYENKSVMILFFNDKDPDSIEVLNKVESIYKNYIDKVNFLMIDISQDVNPDLKDEYSIEIFYDFYMEAAKKYNIMEYPRELYIYKDNEIKNDKTGVPSLDALEANLDLLADNI